MLDQKRIDGLIRKVMRIHARDIRQADREDMKQEARLAAFQASPNYDPSRGVGLPTYLYAAIKYAVQDGVGKIRRNRFPSLDEEDERGESLKDALPSLREPEPWLELDRKWLWQLVARILSDPVLVHVLRLTVEEGWDGEETAEMLAFYEPGNRRDRSWVYHAREKALKRLRQSRAIRAEALVRDALCLK